jgi:hypothetical protein
MLATLYEKGNGCRYTRALISDSPAGPYRFHGPGPLTPKDWYCLDGTLFVENNQPWLVFCHEWVQVGDGEVCAIRLSEDLSQSVGEPRLLFRASEAPWCQEIGQDPKGRVTDGPFFYRTRKQQLLMLWSSFGEKGYQQSYARSETGRLEGPWVQSPEPIFREDGGHGMIFRTFDDRLLLALHQPNRSPQERPRLFAVKDEGFSLSIPP